MQPTFYWHDYETWGANPAVDRPAQFAGVRTDFAFNPIGEPLVIYAKPAQDVLPHPEACLITGITPQRAFAEGLPEADFFRAIHAEMRQPDTCSLGYNSMRFDDEITRYGLYRNFFDPYEREWKHGNSRWDMIDVARITHALRPEGMQWPTDENGVASFRLDQLTQANDISHTDAHDALADVNATIAIAQRIQQAQPRLFNYLLTHRDKASAATLLNLHGSQPVLHVSARYPARLGCIAAVLPLLVHPTNRNQIIVYDLRYDPADLLNWSAERIRERLYTPANKLPEGEQRLALKGVHINRAPVLAPMNTLTDVARERWQMDAQTEQRNLAILLAEQQSLTEKLTEVYAEPYQGAAKDVDFDLYGGFLSDDDKRLCQQIHQTKPKDLADLQPNFTADKLHTLFFRYRARNWPDTLDQHEQTQWHEFRDQRLTDPQMGAGIVLSEYRKQLSQMVVDPQLTDQQRLLINDLLDWPTHLGY